MSYGDGTDRILEPLERTSRGYYLLLGGLLLASAWVLFAWIVQLRVGTFQATSLGDWGLSGGVPWGLYIGSFVWWIGIAHGGIAISAAVRVFKLERFTSVARIAELLTVFALAMAALSIVFSLGRPDRIFNSIIWWPATVHHSPLAWDIAVITLYLVLTLTYLTFTLQPDLYAIRDRVPRWVRPIHSLVLIGYDPKYERKTEKMVWWLALAILALVPMLSGGVVPWLFGFIPAQPGWYGAAAGPAMLVESLTSAIAAVIIIIGVFRYAYGWDDLIDVSVIFDLTKVLTVLVLATLFFVMHDVLTGLYLAPTHLDEITRTVVELPFFWAAMVGMIVSVGYLLVTMVRPQYFTVPRVIAVSAVVTLMILNKKVMFIVEGLMNPSVPPVRNFYPAHFYFPNWVEWSLMLGTIVFAALGFVVLSKVIPMMEIDHAQLESPSPAETERDVDERTHTVSDEKRDGIGGDGEVNR